MKKNTYKVRDLFGNEEVRFVETVSQKQPDLFTDYDAFVEKFEPKRTTDDCYTPPDVYDLILRYVDEKAGLHGRQIVRPFYPGGDFEAIEYPENCVVIDNPPFSIISKIARFYIARNIPFFLFAPHLTLFSSDIDCTHVVVGAGIVYENGAEVKTSFLSNMLGDLKVLGDAELYARLETLKKSKRTPLPEYKYPTNVLTVSHVQWMIEKGVSFQVGKGHTKFCRALASQKPHKKAIFGSGFLISDQAAAEKAAAEKAAAEKAAAAEKNVIVWELSEKERAIIAGLGK